MNHHERNAWNTLVSLGAEQRVIGGKPALDVVSPRTANRLARLARERLKAGT